MVPILFLTAGLTYTSQSSPDLKSVFLNDTNPSTSLLFRFSNQLLFFTAATSNSDSGVSSLILSFLVCGPVGVPTGVPETIVACGQWLPSTGRFVGTWNCGGMLGTRGLLTSEREKEIAMTFRAGKSRPRFLNQRWMLVEVR